MKLESMTWKELLGTEHTIAERLFDGKTYPWEVLGGIGEFITTLGPLLPENEYRKLGKDIWIHKTARMAPGVAAAGPMIICAGAQVRQGAFLRGKVIIGERAVVGNSCELKNAVLFDEVQVPHFNYIGDSILGSKAHFGAGSLTSNVKSDKTLVKVHAADGDIAAGDDAGKAGKGKAYVTLSLSMGNVAPASRANPQGGEGGDGYERGQSYENVVSSAVAFFFRGNGVNASAGTPIDGVAEFSQFSTPVDGNNNPVDKIYTTQPQQVDLENGEYSVIVVANPGDQKWWNAGTLTLGDVRDHIYKEAWKDANGTFSDFLMTSAADATLTLTSEATQQDPADVSATVERVAARIDYKTKGEYTIADTDETIDALALERTEGVIKVRVIK